MTSDTKVGLLLGLVFIVVIAFLMNGLPELLGGNSSSVVLRTTETGGGDALRLDGYANEAVRKVNEEMMGLHFPRRRIDMEENRRNDRRFATGGQTGGDGRIGEHFTPSGKNRNNPKVRVYTVKDGDNLAKIAKKVFGEELGNKNAMVKKIFEANRNSLSTPDNIMVGQKLLIPSPEPVDAKVVQKDLESTGMFDKVKNMINRPSAKKEPAKLYVVKDGDSLWTIAEKILSDGKRFTDIAKLNRNLIPDGESLSVGMRLKLPQN